MMELRSMFSHPATVRLGWTLLHFLWQGAAIAALLGIGLLVMRRARANTRYMIACAALLLMVAAPILTYAHLTPPAATPLPALAEVPELPETAPSETMAVSTPVTDASFTPVPMEPTPLPPAPAPQPWHARAMGWMEAHLNWIVGVWFCGVLVLSIRLLMGWLGVKRMRSSGAAASEIIQKRLKHLAHKLRVTRPGRLLESAATATPVVMGWLRPAILFPASLLTQLSAKQLDAVLAHELAHVRRHDYLVNLLQAVVETLLFYHPAVHWVSRRIRVEREHACDDLAVSACGDSTTYAHALARLAEMNVATPRLVPGASGHLFARIKRLLQVDTPRDNRASVWVGGAVLIALLVTCVVAMGAASAGNERPGDPVTESSDKETPADYSALFEIAGVDEGVRVPTAEEIKRLGLPWPTMPAEENAAYWFAKANKQLIESCKDSPEPPGSLAASEPYAGDAARFTQYVNKNGDVFTLLAEGMSPGRKFEVPQLMIKESRTPTLEMTLLADIRNLGRFVADNGFAAELQGRPAAAADQYLRCVDVGRMAQAEGELINHMVGIVIQDMGAENLDALVGNATLDQETLRRIIARARHAEVSAENRLAMLRVEAAFARSIMAASPQQAKRFAKNYGAYIEAVENALAEPLSDLLKSAAETIKTLQAKYPKPAQTASGFLEILPQHHARINLRLRAIQIRAAIVLYEMKHGDSPKTLSALVPDFLPQVPEDPFSGKPLRYERTGADWKLWSVGYDLKDDGGEAADVDQKAWIGPDFVHTNKVRSNIDRRSGGKIKTLPTSKPAEQTSSAKLRFRLVADSKNEGGVPMKDPKSGETIYVLPEVLMSEADIVSASLQKRERDSKRELSFMLTPDGCRKFADITEKNIGRRLAVVYEGEVVSAPTIMSKISGPIGSIQGRDPKELERIAELINAQKRKPASAADEPLSFGPVIERVVYDYSVGRDVAIDMDSGTTIDRLPELESTEASFQYLQKNGLDAVADLDSGEGGPFDLGGLFPEGLAVIDMAVVSVADEMWRNLSASTLTQDVLLKASKPVTHWSVLPVTPAEPDEKALAKTFVFKTREGGMGILQLLAFTDKHNGVKIRYKMVEEGATDTNGGDSVTREIKFDSETKTETGGICKWEVTPGTPVRLLTAWYVLKDGKWAAYGGPGGRQVADQFYRMGVEWEWAVEGDMLAVSRGTTRFEDDGTMSSRVATKHAIPQDATFKTKTSTEPLVLSHEPTILWRGDWTRDGEAIESVAFVAYAVADGVEPKPLSDSEAGVGH